MTDTPVHPKGAIGPLRHDGFWMDTKEHQAWLRADAARQFAFFKKSFRPSGGFYQLSANGAPIHDASQELFATTRIVHSYALGALSGFENCETMIDHGMAFINKYHRDTLHGGFVWSLKDNMVSNDKKLAYGHAFVLLAAASAMQAGHPDAHRLLRDTTDVLLERYWNAERGVFADEANRDWTPFSTYRGFNANMHATEALLAAYEASHDPVYLEMAGQILDFFALTIAPRNAYRIPEHYTENWKIDRDYVGDPMFRPAGTTPGHSFELARLVIQHWDLSGRPGKQTPTIARHLVNTALADAWDPDQGGLYYTLNFDGTPKERARYWWPITEAIGVLSTLIKLDRNKHDEEWYRRMWKFAQTHFIDQNLGGWFPEIYADGSSKARQFLGKPDLYHSIQATLLPLSNKVSYIFENKRS
jgi:mannose/cellobiose epimerase-like protein (N-acyl-D-glucosamine 2-epimerase family)